jgi:hypothetical protein
MAAMFASKVAKVQTKTTQIPANKMVPQRSTLVARPFGGGAVERAHILLSTIGNQATSRLLSQGARNLNEPHDPNEQDADPAGFAVVTPDGRFDSIALAARHHGLRQTEAWLRARDGRFGWRWDAPVAPPRNPEATPLAHVC